MNENKNYVSNRITDEGGKFEKIVPGYHSLTPEELRLKLELQKQEVVMYMNGMDVVTPKNIGNKYFLISDGNVIKYNIDMEEYSILDKKIWKWVIEPNLDKKLDFDNHKAMEWLEFKDIFEDEKKKLDNDKKNYKIEDGLFGLAVGDALGVPVEFLSRDFLKKSKVTEMMGYGSHDVPEGTWSDDTSLTIAAMDSISQKKDIDYYDIMTKFSAWKNNASYTATNKFFDIGIATSKAIFSFEQGSDPIKCGGIDEKSNGNGSLMRILPFVYYSYYLNLDRNKEVQIINNGSSLTHAHEISRLGCLIFNDYVKMLLDGVDKDKALELLKENDYKKYFKQETIDYYEKILSGKIKYLNETEIKSTGFVVSSLEASIWCILNTNSYENSVIKAVNLGDDTDTVGAITGSIAGIIYGKKNIPNRWISKLKGSQFLSFISNEFVSTLETIQSQKKESKQTLRF